MLQIQILGRGLIPRGYGLAPRKELVSADPSFIQLLLKTRGLTLNYYNPESKKLAPLTKENYQQVYDHYGRRAYDPGEKAEANKVAAQAPTAPHVPANTATKDHAPAEVKSPEKKEDKPAEKPAEKVEEKTEVPAANNNVLKPVTNPNEDKKVEDSKSHNNNGGNNNNKK